MFQPNNMTALRVGFLGDSYRKRSFTRRYNTFFETRSWPADYDGNKVALLLLESNYDACSLSLSPRRQKGGVRTGRRRWTADVSLKARRHQRYRWWDDNDQPQARWRFTDNNLSRLHLFCLLVNDPRSYNHVQGDDMRDSNPTFSCCLARVASPCQVQQLTGDGAAEWIKTIVLSSPFSSTSSTSNRRTALKLGTTDLRDLRNTLVQKN